MLHTKRRVGDTGKQVGLDYHQLFPEELATTHYSSPGTWPLRREYLRRTDNSKCWRVFTAANW